MVPALVVQEKNTNSVMVNWRNNMKYILTFLMIVLIGGGIALSFVGIPAPKSDMRIPIAINVSQKS